MNNHSIEKSTANVKSTDCRGSKVSGGKFSVSYAFQRKSDKMQSIVPNNIRTIIKIKK